MTALPGGLLLGAYRAATVLFGLASPAYLRRRLRRGKEDPARLGERMGHAGRPRPAGRLVWLHGASVGEGIALLPLVERLVARDLRVLLTTGTLTSARILAGRLPAGATHQFVPLDVPAAVRRFLAHWRPELCLLAESELWPNLIVETARCRIPVVLVNARLSRRSHARWRLLPHVIRPLLGAIDLCLAQSEGDAERFAGLGAGPVAVVGNLKFDAAPPPADPAALASLVRAVGTRAVWLAASTHADEESAILEVHRRLQERHPELLTIIVPRQAERGAAIAAQAAARGLAPSLRSRHEPVTRDIQVYVADTMGELGLFYRLATLVFVGKSLGGGGGQNPIEAAMLGCAILHGPQVANFADVYALLDRTAAAAQVSTAADLAERLDTLLTDAAARDAAVTAAAAVVVATGGGAARRIMRALEPLLAGVDEAVLSG